jgi:hypothetical protein
MHNTEVKSEVFSIEMNQKKKKHPKNPTKLWWNKAQFQTTMTFSKTMSGLGTCIKEVRLKIQKNNVEP